MVYMYKFIKVKNIYITGINVLLSYVWGNTESIYLPKVRYVDIYARSITENTNLRLEM